MPRFGAVVALTAGALLLSGCVPEPEPVATPSVEPEPTETALAATRPNPVFALGCADVLTLEEVQSRVTAPIVVKRDETNVPGDAWEVPALQQGALSCRWGGDNRTDQSFDDGVDILLLPDAVSDFSEAATTFFNGTTFTVAGADGAVGTCYLGSEPTADGAPGACSIIALFGSTMVEFRFSDSQQSHPTVDAIGEIAIGLLEIALERASNAGSRPQEWTPPAATIEADAEFCDSVGAGLLAALGVDTPFGGPVPIEGFASLSSCQYFFGATDVQSVGAWVVDGAAWAAGVEQSEGPYLGETFALRTTGSGAQWWLSSTGPAVHGRAAMGGSLVELVVYWGDLSISAEQAQAAITSVMEQYAEAPPGT